LNYWFVASREGGTDDHRDVFLAGNTWSHFYDLDSRAEREARKIKSGDFLFLKKNERRGMSVVAVGVAAENYRSGLNVPIAKWIEIDPVRIPEKYVACVTRISKPLDEKLRKVLQQYYKELSDV
jgi:hypothetical protein